MPYIRRRRAPARRPRRVNRKRKSYAPRPRSMNIFTETYKAGAECAGVNAQGEVFVTSGTSGQGVRLLTQLSLLPQVGSYKTLWSAQKIMKAKFTIVPKWRGEAYNEAALGTAASLGIVETPRFSYAINDYDQSLALPLTETQVLQENGCKIRMFTKPVTVTCRPKPLLEQSNPTLPVGLTTVNTYAKSNPWIEFDDAGPAIQHVGVNGFFALGNSLSAGFAAVADVYVTVTFACKDPR